MSICPAKAHTLVLKDEWVLKVQIGKNLYILGMMDMLPYSSHLKIKTKGFFFRKKHIVMI